MEAQNRLLVILGAGESGVGAAILAKAKGWRVFVSDLSAIKPSFQEELGSQGVEFEAEQHTMDKILAADLLIKSPGIPEKTELMQAIRAKGIKVISEIEFAGYYSTAKHICITGSNGKTTTTMWCYHILKKAGLNVGLAGNVGQSFAKQVATAHYDYYVLELSSFQLDDMYDFRADIAILTNITPDHLDRYNYQMENYVRAKFRILQNQTAADFFIYNADDATITSQLKQLQTTTQLLPFSMNVAL